MTLLFNDLYCSITSIVQRGRYHSLRPLDHTYIPFPPCLNHFLHLTFSVFHLIRISAHPLKLQPLIL